MAFLCSSNMLFSILMMISLHQVVYVSSLEFQVGDTTGWAVPPSNDTNFYNNWASNMRFKIGDTIRFKYKKDSVMEVTENEYKKCNSTRPHFFSNNGNTMFTLDRSGYFYFVSGAAGHCERGERMIVRVLVQDVINDYSAAASAPALALFQQLYALPFVFFFFVSLLY
ncbi:early nodulin-like protein 21 [Nicotiana tabacum]|uniref:Early nodulin-like protein 1 n=1 Tax=Nicotiana tabacum TaxID=4097 RepID=Q8H999_TOBAC|nr:PREDICTED: early nodulin-like protein 1 [Nicotiana tabacum]BAC11949.1 phosphoprotein NtEPb1 [Nicotiana tabacum]